MFRLYSKACEHVIRMLSVLPAEEPDAVFSPKTVARQAKVTESYARKGLQALSQYGLLTAVTGPGGGYRLARPPRQIKVLDIVHAVDGEDCFEQCVLGLPKCGDRVTCPVHETWKPLKKGILASLSQLTLWDLMNINSRK